jgi:hypothetical protein
MSPADFGRGRRRVQNEEDLMSAVYEYVNPLIISARVTHSYGTRLTLAYMTWGAVVPLCTTCTIVTTKEQRSSSEFCRRFLHEIVNEPAFLWSCIAYWRGPVHKE